MKKCVIILLIFLINCSSNKHIKNDRNIEDFQIESKKSTNMISDENESTSVIILPKKDASNLTHEYKFTIFPTDTFRLDKSSQLNFAIIGKEPADISLSWQDNSGNWKTVKNGSKVNDVYNILYDSKYVKENIGVGKKLIKAEILYDRLIPPIVLDQTIFIKEKQINHTKNANNTIGLNLDLTSALLFDDIYFDMGQWKIPSYKFNSNYTISLAKAVKVLKSDENIKIILSGYTDKSGSKQHNLEISKKRCQTVKNIIIDFFPANQQSKISKRIIIKSKGSEELIIDTQNEVKNQLNRRVAISLSYEELPSSYRIEKTKSPKYITNIESQYKDAIKYFYSKNYDDASSIFSSISKNYPKHKLADNAQWWEGEIQFVKKNYIEAIKKYNRVFGLGDGNKEPYAQYRIGCCYKEMNLPERALVELETVKKLYPRANEECLKADQVIKTLN